VEGVDIAAADLAEVVNRPVSYSIALLSTAKHKRLGNAFIDWIRSPDGQRVYTDGGFIGLTEAELAGGECYAIDRKTGALVTTPRVNNSCR
ncbi:MAG TPA: substrate-binding domain-containing protein, partial [Gammaproteobacteria bacterium]|nr:substrate-binding domain-containing protein [Gammaproteobacteria bacterium]